MKYQNANIYRITSIFFAILFLGLLSASVTHAGTYSYVTQWGSVGSNIGQFYNPVGVAVDSSGNIYVTDKGNDRIQKFDSNGKYITQWSSYYNNWKFNRPTGIAIDSEGNIYVANSWNKSIVKMNSKGGFITQWGSEVIGDGKAFSPYGIAIDSSDNVYVVDVLDSNSRIVKFNSNGYYLTQFGSWGHGNGEFNGLSHIAVDSLDNIYVADYNNNRIQKFDSDGNFLSSWGSYGSNSGQFYNPVGVAVDSSGSVYVVDKYNYRIQKFDNSGNYLIQWGSHGSYNGQFNVPSGIAVDSSGYVYVVDTGNNRIQKFAPPTMASPLANFTSNLTSGYAPFNVQFTDKSTNSPTSWKWTFGDSTTSTVKNPTHTYAKAGNYTVTLTATNTAGSNTATKTAFIKVATPTPSKPVAAFTASPTSGTNPLKVQFTDQSTNNPTSWKWDFGDGSATSTTHNPLHTYIKAGSHTVTLTATNTKTAYIKVTAPVKPVAAFTASPTSGTKPLKVQFTDKSTGSPISWKWDFGDGTTSTTHNPLHTYIKKGKLTVTLTVKNSAGTSTKTIKSYITVK